MDDPLKQARALRAEADELLSEMSLLDLLERGKVLIERLTPQTREAIIRVKSEICWRPGYRTEFCSTEIYNAVLNHGVRTVAAWDEWFGQRQSTNNSGLGVGDRPPHPKP